MAKNSINKLIEQRDAVLKKIKNIEDTCEGIDNKNNTDKINVLNIEKAKLLSDKKVLTEQLAEIEKQLNKVNEDISRLSGKGVEKILQAIKNQRWFFIKNKPKVVFDKNTGYLWANLDYFKYKSDFGSYTYDAAKAILKSLTLDGYSGWSIPTNTQMIEMIDDKTFPFKSGDNHRIKDYYYWFVNWNNNYSNSIDLDNYGQKSADAYLLPCCTSLVDDNYKNNVSNWNKVYNEKERLQFTLNLFINNKLEPIFKEQAITELYKQIYIEKPKLIEELNSLQEQIDSLQQVVLLSSTFDYNSLLSKYDINSIDNSIIKYYKAVQLWIDDLMDKLNYFEGVKGDIIKDFNVISLKLSRRYEDNHSLTEEENSLLKNRQQFFKKYFEIGMNGVKNKLLAFKKQAEDIDYKIDEINEGDNAIKELASLEKEERASFMFIAENTAHIVKGALLKIEYFEKNKQFATNIIKLEEKWTESYKVFKTAMKEELKNKCEDDSIEQEVWSGWCEDWRKKRYIIETCFLPLVDKGLKSDILSNGLQIADCNKSSDVTVIEKLIALLETYKEDLDKFYTEERKNIYQKFAFQVGGDLQEKFETESSLYKITSEFQKNMQDIIFALDKAEDRIFLLRWANNLLDLQIDEILDFIKDKELSKISNEVLTQFADLKRKNYENFITDVRSYSEERANREKQYNSLIFKMRKDLMK